MGSGRELRLSLTLLSNGRGGFGYWRWRTEEDLNVLGHLPWVLTKGEYSHSGCVGSTGEDLGLHFLYMNEDGRSWARRVKSWLFMGDTLQK